MQATCTGLVLALRCIVLLESREFKDMRVNYGFFNGLQLCEPKTLCNIEANMRCKACTNTLTRTLSREELQLCELKNFYNV